MIHTASLRSLGQKKSTFNVKPACTEMMKYKQLLVKVSLVTEIEQEKHSCFFFFFNMEYPLLFIDPSDQSLASFLLTDLCLMALFGEPGNSNSYL